MNGQIIVYDEIQKNTFSILTTTTEVVFYLLNGFDLVLQIPKQTKLANLHTNTKAFNLDNTVSVIHFILWINYIIGNDYDSNKELLG